MDFSTLLGNALFPAAYQTANPSTTPEDVRLIQQAVKQLPQAPPGLVRLDETPFNKSLKRDAWTHKERNPGEIWVMRNGKRFRTQDPTNIGALILHEGEHLKGAGEVDARQRELEFLRQAIAGGYANTKLLKDQEKQLKRVQKPGGYYADRK